jgi:hypothetical protein
MRTIVTTADPEQLVKLAGVAWRAATPECRVVWGDWQGQLVGVEPCGKLWAVHVDSEKSELALVSFLSDESVFGAEVWTAVTGLPVPHIAGETVEETIGGANAVQANKSGKLEPLSDTAAVAALDAARKIVAIEEE